MPQLTKGYIQVTDPLTETPTELTLRTSRCVQIVGNDAWFYGYNPDGPFRPVAQYEAYQLLDYVVSLNLWVYSDTNAVLTIEVLS